MADIQDPSNFGGPRPAPGPSPPHERHDSIRDVEKGPEVAACPANNNEEGTDEPSDPGPIHNPDDAHLVFWDSADDPANPYNWPQWRKTLDCTLISLLTFITPLSASMLAPALPQLMRDFGFNITTDTYNNNNNSNYNNTSTTTVATAVAAVARAVTGGDGGSSSGGGGSSGSSLAPLVVSGYFLGFVAGPLSLAPLSERFGRRPVYTACSAGFVALHAASGAAPSLGALLALRFLAGVFGACPLVVGGGTIADVVPRARRGPVMAAFSMGPLLGPVVGPIAGGFVAEAWGWPWVFRLLAIVVGVIGVLMLLFTRESYAPVILRRRAAMRRRQQQQQQVSARSAGDGGMPDLRSKLDEGPGAADYFRQGIFRPCKILLSSPVASICAVHIAVVLGVLTLVLTSISTVFQEYYGFGTGTVGLVYLGLGVGSLAGAIFLMIMSDRFMRRLEAKTGDSKPEHRLTFVRFGVVLIPVGFVLYGWAIEKKAHFMVPILGTMLMGIGNNIVFVSINMYLIDSFTTYAASALAGNLVVRSIGGALVPMSGLRLYHALGLGWGNTVLGFITAALIPVPFIMLKWGETLRRRFEIRGL